MDVRRKREGGPSCVICTNAFSFKDPTNPCGARCPLLLLCGHTACEGCLKSTIRGNKSVTCPICETVSEATKFRNPQELRAEFPLSIYTVGQVSLKRIGKGKVGESIIGFYSRPKNMTSKGVECGECSVAAANCSCRQCNTQLCEACFDKIHSAGVTLRKHQKVGLDDISSITLFEEAMCKNHTNNACKWFCNDCATFCCKDCIFEKHLQHHCIDVFEKNEEILSEFTDLYDEAMGVLKQFYISRKTSHSRGILSRLQCTMAPVSASAHCPLQPWPSSLLTDLQPLLSSPYLSSSYLLAELFKQPPSQNILNIYQKLKSAGNQVQDKAAIALEKQVSDHFSHLHGILQRLEEELLRKVRSVKEDSHASIEIVAEEIEKNIKEIESVLNLSKTVTDPQYMKEVPLTYLMEKLKNITAMPCHLVMNNDEEEDSAKFQFYFDPSTSQFLKTHCTVTTPAKRKCELKTKFDLPSAYNVENEPNLSDSTVSSDQSRDFRLAVKKTEHQNYLQSDFFSSLSHQSKPTLPYTEVKTKPVTGKNELERNTRVMSKRKKPSDTISTTSSKSQESLIENMNAVFPLTEGSTEIVRICHLISPNSFYIQRKCNFLQIEKLRDYFSIEVNIKRSPPSLIEKGQLYIVNYSSDNNWYRGRINSEVGNDTYEVFYIDYGNTEIVNKNKLRELPERYIQLPEQAIHCGLYKCSPVGNTWSPEAYALIFNMSNNTELSMYVERINPNSKFHEVLLHTIDERNVSFIDALIFSNFATYTENTDKERGLYKHSLSSQPNIKKNPFKNIIMKKGEVFDGTVTHVNSPSHFYVQQIVQAGTPLLKLQRELSETYTRLLPGNQELVIYNPTVGMPVASKFTDGNWYRGVIVNIPEPRVVQVKYVDFGNVGTVSCEDIRVLELKFLKIAAQGIKCALSDIAPKHPKGWPASAKTAFEKMVKEKGLLRVYVDEVKEDSSLSIILYENDTTSFININGLLVERGYAMSTGQSSACSGDPFRKDLNGCFNLPQTPDPSVFKHSGQKRDEKGSMSDTKEEQQDSHKKELRSHTKVERQASSSILSSKTEESSVLANDIGGDRARIQVLKVSSPSEIYITFNNIHKRISKLINDMTVFYESFEEESQEWSAGDICAVLREKDNKWYRGLITKIEYSTFTVYIKDIVDVVEVDESYLRSLDSQFMSVPDGSVKCHLGGLKIPAGMKVWPFASIEFVENIINRNEENLYISKLGEPTNDSLPINLWGKIMNKPGPLEPAKEEWIDINLKVIEAGLALPDHAVLSENKPKSLHSSMEKLSLYDGTLNSDNENQPHKVVEWLSSTFEVAADSLYVSDLDKVPAPTIKRGVRGRGGYMQKKSEYVFKLPTETDEEIKVIKEWIPAEPFKKLNFEAVPTFVDNDCAIYLQDVETSASTLELLEKALLNLFGNSEPKPHDQHWCENQMCIAFYEVNNKWYRGKVLKVKPEHIEVLFVDYGNVEQLQPDELRKNIIMSHIPIQCHKCLTEGLIPKSRDGKWPSEALDFIHHVTVDKKCQVTLRAPTETCENYVILSLKIPGNQDLMETLLNMNYATYVIDCEKIGNSDDEEIIKDDEVQGTSENEKIVFPNSVESPKVMKTEGTDIPLEKNNHEPASFKEENSKPIFDWHDMAAHSNYNQGNELSYKDLILPDSIVEFTVEVTSFVLPTASVMVIIEDCDDPDIMALIEEFHKVQENMQLEAENQPVLANPMKGKVCIGCYTEDDTWYRAIVKDVSNPDFVKVFYVDYGNEESIPIDRLREIKPEWTLPPRQAIQAGLYNIREGPFYHDADSGNMFLNCFKTPPYVMVIEERYPLRVELYNNKGELAYQPMIDASVLSKE